MENLENMVRLLEESGQYRVLRRLDLSRIVSPHDGTPVRRGVFLDVETTGLDSTKSEPIEFAMVPFDYTADGRVVATGMPLQQFNEPSGSIPTEITAITGITDEQVAGHTLNLESIEEVANTAAVILAHNAAFDRPFAERISRVFATKPWACTMCDVPWREEGVEGRRLSDLLYRFSYFFDSHRAVDDCKAGIALTTLSLPKSGRRVLDRLLQSARLSTWRIFADGAPFETKDKLKRRGYRWNTDPNIGPRAWYREVDADRVEAELTFLKSEIVPWHGDPSMYEITAYQRYSNRTR